MIPKTLHFVWVGDESKRPNSCIQSWIDLNPSYDVRIWGNADLKATEWHNVKHMKAMGQKELNGLADIMRYEILYYHGGIALDADSVCLRSLEDWLLEPDDFACWENELLRPGLIAAGYMGAVKGSLFQSQIIQDILALPSVTDKMAWETVGPKRVTDTYRKTGWPLTIYPSHYFIPKHFAGYEYDGKGQVFADQLWGSTKGNYDEIAGK